MSNLTKIVLTHIIVILIYIRNTFEIIGGHQARNVDYPSTVVLKYRSNNFCGAAIVLPRWILTTATCASPKNDSIEGFVMGFHDLRKFDGPVISFEKSHIHPEFERDGDVAVNDLALFKLLADLKFNQFTYGLPIEPIASNPRCKIAGYGVSNIEVYTHKISEDMKYREENYLYEIKQEIVDIDECNNIKKSALILNHDYHLCVKGESKGTGPSYGDLGGPLICDEKQVAISSQTIFTKTDEYLYTVYIKLAPYENWLTEIVKGKKKDDTIKRQEGIDEPEGDPAYKFPANFQNGNQNSNYTPMLGYPSIRGASMKVLCNNYQLIIIFWFTVLNSFKNM